MKDWTSKRICKWW